MFNNIHPCEKYINNEQTINPILEYFEGIAVADKLIKQKK